MQTPDKARRAFTESENGGGDEVSGVPLKLGHPRHDVDHNGAECITIDCIYNDLILKEAAQNRYGSQ